MMSAALVLPSDHAARMDRLRLSLDGLSIGDAFGQRFFGPVAMGDQLVSRQLPPGPWKYTDDTEMALALASVLETQGTVDSAALAAEFAARFAVDPHRCYGAGMHTMLDEINRGRPWREAAASLFGGEGSLGNGSAMRVAPLGAYFADDFATVATQARISAAVTHLHPEGAAGAIAVAIAAAWAWQWNSGGRREPRAALLANAYQHTPDGSVRQGIARAQQVELDEWEFTAAEMLGNGGQITCADTVPFCLWIATRHLDSFTDAMWNTVRAGGDIDTNAAIVGGIVSLAVGRPGVPEEWRRLRESLVWRV